MEQSSTDAPILIYDRIDSNRRKTRWLLAGFVMASVPIFLFIAHNITGIVAMSIFMQAASSPESAIAPIIGISTGIAVLLLGVATELLYRYSSRLVLRLTVARPLDPEEEPTLVRTVENLCIGAGLPMPQLAIVESRATNVYSTGLEPDKATLVVTRGLLEALDRRELEGVVAQELSQIGNGDVRLGTVLATVMTIMLLPYLIGARVIKALFRANRGRGIGCLLFPLLFFVVMIAFSAVFGLFLISDISDPTERLLFMLAMFLPLYALFIGPAIAYMLRSAVSREREFLADADAVLLTRYPPGLAQALAKIAVPGNAAIATQPSISHLWIVDPRKPKSTPRTGLFATHPPIRERIEALSRMGGSTPEMLAAAEAAGNLYRDTFINEKSKN
jgi:heat shock protein HtpX